MSKESVTLPPGHYIIADPRYFSGGPIDDLPDLFFWSGGDGAFYDNFKNCYHVDSGKIGVFEVHERPEPLQEGTHYFFFKQKWTIDFDQFEPYEQIKITVTPHRETTQERFYRIHVLKE